MGCPRAGLGGAVLPNLELFLKGWSGDMIRIDRLGRPPDYIQSTALTLGLTVQPAMLKQIFGMPGFHGRGLLARVLYSMPPSTIGQRQIRPNLSTRTSPAATASRYSAW